MNNKVNFAKLFAENRAKVIKQRHSKEEIKIKSKIDKLETTNLWDIDWVWESTIKTLLENWISSLDELKEAWIRKIKKLKLNPFSSKAINNFIKNK